MSDDKDENGGGKVLLIGLVLAAALTGLLFVIGHYRDPTGWNRGWISGDLLVVEEYREDDGSEDERIAVHDLATGKRLTARDPSGRGHAFAVVNGRVWLYGVHEPGLEAWSVKDLKTVVDPKSLGIAYADSNVCSDGAFARVMQKDGRYAVVDLGEAKLVADRRVSCESKNGSASSSGASARGYLSTATDGASQRLKLERDKARLGGAETFLEPQYLFVGGGPVEVDGDLFVIHRVELGENRALKLSRVCDDALKWTLPLGDPSSIDGVAFAPPSTLVVIGHRGLTAVNVATGKPLWRAGR